MFRFRLLLLFSCMIGLLLPTQSLQAADMKSALNKAATSLAKSNLKILPKHNILLQVLNYHSGKRDTLAKGIETELYFALERRFPKAKLVLLSENITGISSVNTIIVKGTYEKKGKKIIIRLQAVKGLLDGELLAQVEVSYQAKTQKRKTLVAVLDIQSDEVSKRRMKIYSEIFRSALVELETFNLASSADIDRMDPDAIQKSTGCTRDECATIIGEQLGVDRTISTSLFKISDKQYFLSSKMLDIKDGSIVLSKTLEHKGGLEGLPATLIILAQKITGQAKAAKSKPAPMPEQPAPSEPEAEPEQPELGQAGAKSNLVWHIAASSVAVLGFFQAGQEADSFDALVADNENILEQYKLSTSLEDRQAYLAEYNDNQDQMSQHEKNIQTYNLVMLLGLGWEAYVIYNDFSTPATVANHQGVKPATGLRFAFLPGNRGMTAHLSMEF